MPTSSRAPVLVETDDELRRLVSDLEGETVLAVDTEFVRERSYDPKLELVQIATAAGDVALVDTGALGDGARQPLAKLLGNEECRKVFHAAEQDLELLHGLLGFLPTPIWDTQLVTSLFGYDGRTGYGAVVASLLGERPVQGETLTDWSARPFTPEQLRYAAEDVRFLLPLYELERSRLDGRGRLDWAEIELEGVCARVRSTLERRAEPAETVANIRGARGLRRRSLAVLAELASWREREAERRDRPRGSILKDDVLVALAKRAPKRVADLKSFRRIQARDVTRYGEDIVAAVAAGLRLPLEQCPPAPPQPPELTPTEASLAALLQAVIHAVGLREDVTPGFIARTAEIRDVVASFSADRSLDDHPLLRGWRGELVGRELVEILEGKAAVSWNPETRAVRVVRSGID